MANYFGGTSATLTNGLAISTTGSNQPGIFISPYSGMSLTFTNSGAISTTGQGSNAVNIFAKGGAVTLENTATISTTGSQASGLSIFTQQGIVGAAPNGAISVRNSGDISVGQAFAVMVSTSGNASVDNTGKLTVTGERTSGIQANSGWGNITSNGVVQPPIPGGNISVTNTGAMVINGRESSGIFSSSVGGSVTIANSGGGITATGENAGAIRAFTGQQASDGSQQVQPGYQSTPQSYYKGGDISVTNSAALSATGLNASGIAAGSIGGAVNINNSGTITMSGQDATGIAAYSDIGNLTVVNSGAIALSSGANTAGISIGSDSGTVSLTNSGAITGSGAYAKGLQADANGMGGTAIVSINSSGSIALSGIGSYGIQANTDGGAVTVNNSGAIAMTGAGSIGIFGVNSGTSVAITTSKDIVANAANSYAIAAIGLNNANINVTVNGGTVRGGSGSSTFGIDPSSQDKALLGSAGVLIVGGANNTITNKGVITAANGQAINVVQGTYAVTDQTSTGQLVTKNVTFATSNNAIANSGEIAGRVTLGSGNDSINNSGKITGDIALGAGNNALTNTKDGTIAGNVTSGTGNTTLLNAGIFTGNVNLGTGTNSLANLDGGTFNSMTNIYLGAGNTFTNAGTLSPGGVGTIQTTTITGNYTQSSTGKLVIDINEKAAVKSDSLIVTGTANLAGTIVTNVLDFNQVVKSEYKIVSAAGGITNNGISANPNTYKVADTVGYDFGVEQRNATDLYLTARRQNSMSQIADAAAQAAGAPANSATAANMSSVGNVLTQSENMAGNPLSSVVNAVRLQSDSKAAADTINRLIPQNQAGQSSSTSGSGVAFGNAMLSCAEREGPFAYTREGKCYYAKATVRRLDRDATTGAAGVREDGLEVMGGAQVALSGNVRLGFAGGYEDINSKSFDTRQKLGETTGSRTHGGIVIKDQWGPISAYLNIAGSYGSYDHRRFVNLAGIGQTATSSQDVISGVSRLRFSYLSDMGPWYWKPLIDASATYINSGGYNETGATAANLHVNGSEKWLFGVMPGIEFGGQLKDASNTIYRPYVRVGATFFNTQTYNVTANFQQAPVGIQPFLVTSKLDSMFADVEVGMHILSTSGFNIRMDYEGRFGQHSTQNAGTLKATLPLQ